MLKLLVHTEVLGLLLPRYLRLDLQTGIVSSGFYITILSGVKIILGYIATWFGRHMPTFRRRHSYILKIEMKRKRSLYKMFCVCVCLCVYHFLMPTRPEWNAHRILLAEFVGRQALGSKGGDKKTILQWI